MRVVKKVIVLIAALQLFTSCMTDKSMDLREFEDIPLIGMIYDMDNEPVPYARIRLDDREEETISDINGRFMVYQVSSGNHTLHLAKEDYESVSVTFDFYDKAQVVYSKMTSYNQLLQSVEDLLAKRKYDDALVEIKRAETLKSGEPVLQYLKAVCHFQVQEYEVVRHLLLDLQHQGFQSAAVINLLEMLPETEI